MKQQIKNWVIQWIIITLTVFVIWVTYANSVSTWDTLTADLFNEKTVPTGAVMSFALDDCPTGWDEYIPAQGRVIRWIDKTGTNIDPDGERAVWNTQEDLFQWHGHDIIRSGTNYQLHSEWWVANEDVEETWTNDDMKFYIDDIAAQLSSTTPEELWLNWTPRYGTETRSKNVSLLFCLKDLKR